MGDTKYQAGTRVSEYLLEECIGRGTFGEVWRARHHVWDKEHVAIKLPTEPEYVRFLRQEGVMVHGLRHPNIVRVLGLDPYADVPYLVMELVRGPSLRQVLGEHPHGVAIDTAVTVLRGLLRAMTVAHEANIVHRDLKPGNVLLNLDGRPLAALTVDDVKVVDFGLGAGNADTVRSLVMQSASLERNEQSAALTGTLAYMAPELREGEDRPSARSDLYSIGVMLFELLTGDRPAGAELPSTVRAEVPPALDEVFRRLYARADRRYESATAVLADLDARLGGAGSSARAILTAALVDLDARLGGAGRLPPLPAGVGAGPRRPPPLPNAPLKSPATACPSCRTPLEPDDQFCTQCGRQVVEWVRRCPVCGGFPARGDRYCIFCGGALPAPVE